MWRNFKFSEAHCTVVDSAPVLQEATVSAKSAVACLAFLSAQHGAGAMPNVAKLRSNLNDSRQLPISEFISIAAEVGLRTQYVCRDWYWLKLETITGPVFLLLKNGNTVVAITGGGDQEIVISDPLYNDGKILTLSRKELDRVWDGEALSVVPRAFEGEVYRLALNRDRQNRISPKAATKRRYAAKLSLFPLAVTLVPAIVVMVIVARELAFEKTLGLAALNRLYEHSPPAPTEAVTPPTIIAAPAIIAARISTAASTTAPEPATPPGPATPPKYAISAIVSDHVPAASRAAISSGAEDPGNIDAMSPENPSGNVHSAVVARPFTAEALALRARGDNLFGSGDILSARLFYERAAEGGDGQAALQLGETYDPDFLQRAGVAGIRGDGATARRWYQQALELGASEAQTLLNAAPNR